MRARYAVRVVSVANPGRETGIGKMSHPVFTSTATRESCGESPTSILPLNSVN